MCCVGKTYSCPLCLFPLFSHRTLHFWDFWSANMQGCGGSHTQKFYDTSLVSYNLTQFFFNNIFLLCYVYNLTQFWHYLLRDSIQTHGLRVQSPPLPPHTLQMPIASGRSLCYPHLLSNVATNQKVHDLLPLGFDYLLKQLTELRETLSLHLPIFKRYYKGYK